MREYSVHAIDMLISQLEHSHSREVAIGEASRWTQLHHIERLVAAGVSVDCRIGERLVTPLMMAGKNASAKCLIRLGADVNAVDANGQTALMWLFISSFRKTETLARVKFLLQSGADTTSVDHDGKTAYDYAMIRNDIHCMALLETKRVG